MATNRAWRGRHPSYEQAQLRLGLHATSQRFRLIPPSNAPAAALQ